MDFIHRTAEGQLLSAQDKRGALAISPSIVLVARLVHVEVEVVVEGVVAVDGVEVVVPVVGDIVVVGGGGPWRWQQTRWHLGVGFDVECLACCQWVAGSSLLLPEHFQRFPRGLWLASGLRG